MLKIYDFNKNPIGYILKYKDFKIEGELSTADKTLSFTYLAKTHEILEEYYIRTETDEYVVKQVKKSSRKETEVEAVLNTEELDGKSWQKFTVKDVTAGEAARHAVTGTGWRVVCSMDKLRSLGVKNVSAKVVLQKICVAYMCEMRLDSLQKIIYLQEEFGEDKGAYFLSDLNLKDISLTSDTYDYYTRIIPVGKDGLKITDVNGGKEYLENYQYTNKVLEYVWEDTSYEDTQALKDDAAKKLDDLSKPQKAYSGTVWDLAKSKPEYSILSYGLGDTVWIIDSNTGIRDRQRITKLTEYPQEPTKNTCEMSNTYMSFEEYQQQVQEAASLAKSAIDGDGTINGANIDTITIEQILNFYQEARNASSADFEQVETDIQHVNRELVAVKGQIGTLEANVLTAEEADLKYATIQNLNATDAKVQTIEGTYAEFKTTVTGELDAQRAEIEDLSTKKLSAEQADLRYATIANLNATNAEVATLQGNFAEFETTVTGQITAVTGQIGTVSGDLADYKKVVAGELEAVTAEFESLGTKYAEIDLANIEEGCITTAMIGTGVIGTSQIADGSITDAKIVTLSASKLTAGKIDAAEIEVVNLNAANITVGTINGQQIASGAIDLSKLSSSLSATITTTEADVKKALQDAQDAISDAASAAGKATAAQTTADGKNTIFYQASAPATSGRKTNDLWFDTDDGNRIYCFNGTTWVAKQFGTNAIANAAITNALIADATIQSAKIAGLDAGKITSGYINAARLQAGVITSDKVAAGAIVTDKLAAGAVTALKLAAGAVETDKLAANAVTAGKIAANAVEAGNIKAGAVTTDKISAGAISADKLAANAVTTEKIVSGAVTSAKIAAKAVTANNIAANAITTEKLTSGAVTADKLAVNSVTAVKIAANSVTADKILSGAITTEKLAADSITSDKIATKAITLDKILFNNYNLIPGAYSNFYNADTISDVPVYSKSGNWELTEEHTFSGKALKVTGAAKICFTSPNRDKLVIPVKASKKYRLSWYFYSNADLSYTIATRVYDQNGSLAGGGMEEMQTGQVNTTYPAMMQRVSLDISMAGFGLASGTTYYLYYEIQVNANASNYPYYLSAFQLEEVDTGDSSNPVAYTNDVSNGYIDGSNIVSGVIRSTNYSPGVIGTMLNLYDGSFDSPNLKWDRYGNLTLNGNVQADNGTITGATLVGGEIKSRNSLRGSRLGTVAAI